MKYDIIDTNTGKVVEGGFFDEGYAIEACNNWNWLPPSQGGGYDTRYVVKPVKK